MTEQDNHSGDKSPAGTEKSTQPSDREAHRQSEPPKLEKRASERAGKEHGKKSQGDSQHLPEPLDIEDIPVARLKRKKRSLPVAAVLITVLLLGALAGGGYYGWRYVQQYIVPDEGKQVALQQQVDRQAQQLQQLREQLNRQIQDQEGLAGQWQSQLEQRLQADRQQLDELQRRVTSQGSRLRDLSTTTRDDWLLAEAEYLLRLANQRLLTERTTANPVALLETADGILKDFDDPDLFAVRRQIANDITALKVSGTTDREGLYLQLSSLTEVIPQLQLLVKPTGEPEQPVAGHEELASPDDGWGDRVMNNFGDFAEGLKNYVRIRRRDQPLEPLLSVEEELYLRHNLRTMLEQAQLAMLREEPQIYRASLQKCIHWLQRHFELNQASSVLAEQLDELSRQTITRQLPDISGSLQALRNYINLWHLRHEGSEAPQSTGQDSEQ